MATSGSTSVKVTNWDTLKFSWRRNSYSVEHNNTTIYWSLQLVSTAYGRISSTASKDWSVTVNGKKYSGTNTVGIANNATKTLASGTTTIAHNTDGTKTFSYSFSQEFAITFSGSSIGTKSGSGSGTLDTIPRATTPELSASSVFMGDKVTISLPRASSSFTHDLAYSFNGSSYASISTGVSTSYTWTVPDKATSIPNALNGIMTIRCTTKNGSTTVGTKTVKFTAKVADALPTISVQVSEAVVGIDAQFHGYVQNKSRLAIKIEGAGAKGSTIKSYKAVIQGKTYKTAEFTSDVLTKAGTYEIYTSVTDSRGVEVAAKPKITVMNYWPPEIPVLHAYRCASDGTVKLDGDHVAVVYEYGVSAQGNTAKMAVQVKPSTDDDASYTTVATGTEASGDTTDAPLVLPLSPDYSYDLRLQVTDFFGTKTTATTFVPSAEVILDIGAAGDALAVGGTAEEPGFTVKWKARLLGGRADPVLPDYTNLDQQRTPGIYAGNSVKNSNYVNCPIDTNTSFTLEVAEAGAAGQLLQRFTTRNKSTPQEYVRHFYANAWGPWFCTGFESAWQDATLGGDFLLFNSGQPVKYRRSGGTVEVKGEVKPAADIAYSADWYNITTLPEDYRPTGGNVYALAQGSGKCIWLLRVTTGGAVQMSRYRNGSEDTTATAAGPAWLPFHVTFLV